jgi:rhodanese-related sulfurtransferase
LPGIRPAAVDVYVKSWRYVRQRDEIAAFSLADAQASRYIRGFGENAVSPSDGLPSKHCATLDASRRLRMDEAQPISPHDLYARLGTAGAPVLVDVRRDEAFGGDDRMIVGAIRRRPEDADRWQGEMKRGRPVVAYCVHGHEVSQGAAKALRRAGLEAAYLVGGIAGWTENNLPTRRKRGPVENKWVTREHPKIDRIACPWLVSRFINPDAEFIYVPPARVSDTSREVGGTPYDIDGVEFGHVGDRCSFDAIVSRYGIHDGALDHLATIVRGADTSRPDLTPQGEGLLAISYGLSANHPDDHEMLRHGLVMYDALYTWCRMQAGRQASPAKAKT